MFTFVVQALLPSFLLLTILLTGCQTQSTQNREAQADLQILKPKPIAQALKAGEDLREPRPGLDQEPKDAV